MINEIPVDIIIDTGASIDILDETAYHKVNYSGKITLKPSTKRLFAYVSKSQLHVIGSFEATVTFRNNRTASTLHVLQGSHGSLLSYSTAVALGILDIRCITSVAHPCVSNCSGSTHLSSKVLANERASKYFTLTQR